MSYIKNKEIGHGSYSKVYKSECIKTNKTVAIKVIPFNCIIIFEDDKNIYTLKNIQDIPIPEITFLKLFDHPNIVKYIEHYFDMVDYKLNIIMDYMPKNLLNTLITQGTNFNNEQIRDITKQILSGLEYIHNLNIIHCDIKSGNIILDDQLNIKIIDFGISKKQNLKMDIIVQTLFYRAPEIIMGFTDYTTKIDIWSVGCIFYELHFNNFLFKSKTEDKIFTKICKFFGTPNEDNCPNITSYPKWNKIYEDYPNKSLEILGNKNIKHDAKDLFVKMMLYDLIKRISARDALKHKYFDD